MRRHSRWVYLLSRAAGASAQFSAFRDTLGKKIIIVKFTVSKHPVLKGDAQTIDEKTVFCKNSRVIRLTRSSLTLQ